MTESVCHADVHRTPVRFFASGIALVVATEGVPLVVASKTGAQFVVERQHRHRVQADGEYAVCQPVEGEVKVFQLVAHVPVAAFAHLGGRGEREIVAS